MARLRHFVPPPIVSTALTLSIMLALILPLQESSLSLEPTLEHPGRFAEFSTTTNPYPFTSTTFPERDVSILVYHIVRPSSPDDSAEVRALAQTPEVFDAQLQHLAEAGYHVIPLDELVRALRLNTPLPSKPIVITFDDGWRNQFVYGFPIIEKYHYPATYFVFTDAVNKRGFMTWDNLRVLLDAGMSIGSHTRTHPFLTQVSDEKQLEQEIAESRHILEHKLHIRVDDFAYPFGQFNQHTVALVKRAGYASARGDFYSGKQSLAKLYGLSAMNVPTTLERFVQVFP